MSRIERKYCLSSTSYLQGLFDLSILLHIWQNCVCFGDFLSMKTHCDAWIWISLAFNPGHIWATTTTTTDDNCNKSLNFKLQILGFTKTGCICCKRWLIIQKLMFSYFNHFVTRECCCQKYFAPVSPQAAQHNVWFGIGFLISNTLFAYNK